LSTIFANRVIVVPGDLAQPLLGLTPESFADLSQLIDAIYHAGAIVNFLKPYAAMRAANVQGTQEVIRLACRTRPKLLHHISTIAVFSAGYYTGRIAEDTLPTEVDGLPGGYSQSKWVAEQLVLEAMNRGLPARIYRPGLLAGDSRLGISNLDNVMSQLFRATCQIGLMPDLKWQVDVSLVDVAAQTIAHISTRTNNGAQIFHLCNPEPTSVDDLIMWVRALGIPLDIVPYARWREEMLARAADLKFEQLLPLLPENETEVRHWLGTGERRFEVKNTLQALDGSPVTLTSIDRGLFAVYVRHLEQHGLLPMSLDNRH